MKKIIVMSVLMCMTLLTACGTKKVNGNTANEPVAVEETTATEAATMVEQATSVNTQTTSAADKGKTNENQVVQASNTAAAQSDETINANLQKMKTIFRAISGYLVEEKSYDGSSDSQYWEAIRFATNEYVNDYHIEDLDGNGYNNYCRVSPEIIGEMAYVLFPDRLDYKTVDIPKSSGSLNASYDEASNSYNIEIGELGTLAVRVEDFARNEDGSITVMVRAYSAERDVTWHKTMSFTLINNEDPNNSDFPYAIKDANMVE